MPPYFTCATPQCGTTGHSVLDVGQQEIPSLQAQYVPQLHVTTIEFHGLFPEPTEMSCPGVAEDRDDAAASWHSLGDLSRGDAIDGAGGADEETFSVRLASVSTVYYTGRDGIGVTAGRTSRPTTSPFASPVHP